jgi:diketogulonate reductase-like aldo/keto reductase
VLAGWPEGHPGLHPAAAKERASGIAESARGLRKYLRKGSICHCGVSAFSGNSAEHS